MYLLNFAKDSFHGFSLEGYCCNPDSHLHVGPSYPLRLLTTKL